MEVMKKSNEKMNWVIGVCCTDCDGVEIHRVYGTKKQVKAYMTSMMREERKEKSDEYDFCHRVANNDCWLTSGELYGVNVFNDHHTDYSAYVEKEPVVL